MPSPYGDEVADWRITLDDLRSGSPTREVVESEIEAWLPNLGNGYTYDDILDRLEVGSVIVDGRRVRMVLPDQTDDPVYVRLRGIAKRLRAESE